MANRVYPTAIAAMMKGLVDLDTDDIRLMLVKEAQGFSSLDEFVDDFTGSNIVQRMAAALQNVTITTAGTGATLDADDTTFPAVPASLDNLVVVLYSNEGVDDTARRLLAWIDTGGNIPRVPDGDDIPITFSNATSKILTGV